MALDREILSGSILITGGTGTLGHAIVYLAQMEGWPCEFTVYARSELKLAIMKQKFPSIRTIIGDVRDYDRLSASVPGHTGVIHAAAMKRIPECEHSPLECYQTNVLGSYNVCRASKGYADWVVGISTDKACQAITTYGASKLMMESIFLRYSMGDLIKARYETRYIVVRYGNVVASNGSVIPLWKAQYESGIPLTVTDKAMTRFWMSPFDAVRTICRSINAGLLAGSVYIPKVDSCSMVLLASHMFPDCNFTEIGLRSNEKVHESLVSVDEPCIEYNNYISLNQNGGIGRSYTSSSAKSLSFSNFDLMLREAELLEQL